MTIYDAGPLAAGPLCGLLRKGTAPTSPRPRQPKNSETELQRAATIHHPMQGREIHVLIPGPPEIFFEGSIQRYKLFCLFFFSGKSCVRTPSATLGLYQVQRILMLKAALFLGIPRHRCPPNPWVPIHFHSFLASPEVLVFQAFPVHNWQVLADVFQPIMRNGVAGRAIGRSLNFPCQSECAPCSHIDNAKVGKDEIITSIVCVVEL